MRRPKLPGTAELFRPTAKTAVGGKPEDDTSASGVSGRVRHDEKITVYFSSEELIRLEDARLGLRRNHKLAVDRGRIVRAAVALALADLEENGQQSALYRHLEQ